MEERDYAEFAKLARKLGLPMLQAFIELEVSKDGLVIGTLKQRSHSWTRNAYNHMFSQLAAKNISDATFEGGKLSLKNTAGGLMSYEEVATLRHTQSHDEVGLYGYLSAAGDDTLGIIVGSGVSAESFEDYFLETQIEDGAGANQLNHAASELHSISYSDTTLKDMLVRYFNNNSGASIDVNEVGLVIGGYRSTFVLKWLQSRDKLPATVTVPDTGQLKVTYTIQLTYPA